MRGWYGWLLDLWARLRESYWFYPGQMTIYAGLLAVGAVEIDRRVPPEATASIPWLSYVSAESARSVLSTVAGSMMTVTGVVFSITIVALTLTSSQFGPRLLRTFFRDRGTQISLGAFLATYLYSLVVLRAVENPERVPYIATAGSVVFAIVSVFVLIFFIHHAASSLQASSVIAAVSRELEAQIPSLFPDELGEGGVSLEHEDRHRLEHLDREGLGIRIERQGYIHVLDEETICELAEEKDLLIRIESRPGHFVSPGTAFIRVLPRHGVTPELESQLRKCCILGDHGTPIQDLTFMTAQLVEMALRALSTGINDPRTAIACIHRLRAVLVHLANREMPSRFRFDKKGDLRIVIAEPMNFDMLVGSCFDSIRRHGARDPEVVVALLEAIRDVAAECRDPGRIRILRDHAEEIRSQSRRSTQESSRRDRALVEEAFERILTELAR